MIKIKFSHLLPGAVFSLCLATVPAEAIVDHTYVSGKGTDAGGCISPASACRTFTYAIAQTSASGEIIVLDPADYSPVTITKSISIIADGAGPAGIIVATGAAITISAGASDVVNLRGLTLDGEGTAGGGIVLNSAGALTISDCVVRHFAGSGILLQPSSALNFRISNTTSADDSPNGGGLSVLTLSGAIVGVVDRFTATNNGFGIGITGGSAATNITILNSVLSNNRAGTGGLGIAGPVTVTVRKSVANNNGYGFLTEAAATLTLADSMAIGNSQAGVKITTNSKVFSYGDNEINGNGTDVLGGTLTAVTKR